MEHSVEDMRRQKAKQILWKKSIHKELNLQNMMDQMQEISEKCGDVEYVLENESEETLGELLGDDDTAYEFRLAFSDLDSECDMVSDMLWGLDDLTAEHFDDFFVALTYTDSSLFGYDSFEDEWYDLESYMTSWAVQEASKRLQKLTKQQLIEVAQASFRVATLYLNIKDRFDSLNATYDIMEEHGLSIVETMKCIDEAYEEAEKHNFELRTFNDKLDRLTEMLPVEFWVI